MLDHTTSGTVSARLAGRRRWWRTGAAVAAGAALVLAWSGVATAASQPPVPVPPPVLRPPPPPRKIAACQNRVCVLVLSAASDTDGDGVADIDERYFGTDPTSASSLPSPMSLINAMEQRRLPSFEQHLTEVVDLPEITPDGESLATGFGPMGLPASHSGSSLYPDLDTALSALGIDGVDLGFGLSAVLPAQPVDLDPGSATLWDQNGRMALVADGADAGSSGLGVSGIVGPTTLGGNGDKTPSSISNESWGYSGAGGGTHNYDVTYTDGSHDQVTSSKDETGATATRINSYDSGDTLSAVTVVTTGTKQNDDGTKTSTQNSVTTTYDSSGNKTGSSSTNTSTTTGNGTRTTTTTTETDDKDGNKTSGSTTTTTTTDCTGKVNCGGDDKMSDPDYVASGPVTAADVQLVVSRLNVATKPGPDDGSSGPVTAPPPAKWPMVALIDGDGVTVIAAGATPRFNSTQPDYDPRLQELGGYAGAQPPTRVDGTIYWH